MTSQQSDAGSIRSQIVHALGRLEMGLQMNNHAGEERVKALRQHMDTRLSDLRQDMGSRIDRVEQRIWMVEVRPISSSESRPPWWQDMSPRERLTWLVVVLSFVAAALRPELADRILSEVMGPIAGTLLK